VLRHDGEVTYAAFRADGTRLVTASTEGEVFIIVEGRSVSILSDAGRAQLWSAQTGEELAVLRHEGEVQHAAFSPDGERVVTASWDGTARLWFVYLRDLLELAESQPVTLTPEERVLILER
jgi:WD40 repeat protein